MLLLLLLFEVVGKDADHVGEGGRMIRERLRRVGEEGVLRRPRVRLFLVVGVVVEERRRRVVQHVLSWTTFRW